MDGKLPVLRQEQHAARGELFGDETNGKQCLDTRRDVALYRGLTVSFRQGSKQQFARLGRWTRGRVG